MMRWPGSLTTLLPVLVLLVAAEPAKAFGFCFSFGSRSQSRPHYNTYALPYPGVAAPLYPGYGYSPVPPAYNYNNSYYPPPSSYETVYPEAVREQSETWFPAGTISPD
jgi:hypothetical protein